MLLSDLVLLAEQSAEDWGEFRLIIEMDGHGSCEDVAAVFNVDKGTLTLTEKWNVWDEATG